MFPRAYRCCIQYGSGRRRGPSLSAPIPFVPMTVALAVDIGGTKMAAALVDDAGEMERRSSVATPRGHDPEELFEALAGLVRPLVASADVVGVGTGGPMTAGGERVTPLNI